MSSLTETAEGLIAPASCMTGTHLAPGIVTTRPEIATPHTLELWPGRYQDVLAHVEADSLISDPPYSARTVRGFRTGTAGCANGGFRTADIGYAAISKADCQSFVESWAPRIREWVVLFGDHTTARWWQDAFAAVGWYVFPTVAWVKQGAAPRYMGDGPSSQIEHITIARPRVRVHRRYRPGWYQTRVVKGTSPERLVTGQKPLDLMRALMRDYSEPGGLIVDPFAGSGSTLVAAHAEARRAIGAEVDPVTFAKAADRIRGLGEPPALPANQE